MSLPTDVAIASLADVAVSEVAAVAAAAAASLAANEARRIRKKVEMVDKHERILEGDDATSWPGLVEIVTDDDVEVEYGQTNDRRQIKR